jgi:urea carboxylase
LYASKLRYKSAGTVEFLVDDTTGDFFFLEMNTRLQVEHGITEMCYDVDLALLMLWQADWEKSGATGIPTETLLKLQKDGPSGAAVEGRVYAEVPHRNFAPSSGLLQAVAWPQGEGVRVDTWVKTGQQVSPHYDPLLAKVMVHSQDRETCLRKMLTSLEACVLQGFATNLEYLSAVIASPGFQKGETLTSYIDKSFTYVPCGFDVIRPGAFTTIQDYPGRATIGHGVPRSGPMDNLSSRIANILVGNAPGTECLEMTLSGPELLFTAPAVVSVCGAPARISIDGSEKPMWSRIFVRAGQTLQVGAIESSGCRNYLAVKGGFPKVAVYLGSKSTTPSLNYGGMQGRQLRANDHIVLSAETESWVSSASEYSLPESSIPSLDVSEVYCLHGPHDDDGYMTAADREMLYTSQWTVGHNSNRAGVRLVGPIPQWSREDGGAGGAHPSNVFDYGYSLSHCLFNGQP